MKFKLSKLSLSRNQSSNKFFNILSPTKQNKEVDFCLDLNAFQEEEDQIREYCRECIKSIEENNFEEAHLLLNNKEITNDLLLSILEHLKTFVETDHYTIEFQGGKMSAKAEIWDCLHKENGEHGKRKKKKKNFFD